MATLTSIAYSRTRVRRGRTGQRVRVSAVVTAQVGGVFNLTRAGFANYARTSQRAGGPHFAWSPYPTPPFEHDSLVQGAATCTEARFAWQPGGRIALVCNNNGVIEERGGDDDGYSFNAAIVTFATGSHPDITAGRGGEIVSLAYRGGEIVGTRQTPAGATPSAEFTLKDDAAADIAVEDDVFRLVEDDQSWWWLHCRPAGAGSTALLFSTDVNTGPTQTFAETSGAVTGIASGLNPGICTSQVGTLYAWARIGTSGWITYRHPGSTAWATPVEMVDDASDPLEFAAQPFSITSAPEGSARLVLAAVMNGESLVSEWWSADERGLSWKAFPPG